MDQATLERYRINGASAPGLSAFPVSVLVDEIERLQKDLEAAHNTLNTSAHIVILQKERNALEAQLTGATDALKNIRTEVDKFTTTYHSQNEDYATDIQTVFNIEKILAQEEGG